MPEACEALHRARHGREHRPGAGLLRQVGRGGPARQQKKITRKTKELGFKKLYQILIVIDDFADQPELHRRTGDGALDTFFIHGRHMQISTWVSSQKLRLISAAVRVNMQFMCVWRLRNQLELEAVLEALD
eukprot:s9277_g1.t1